jgi:hypothetical protein
MCAETPRRLLPIKPVLSERIAVERYLSGLLSAQCACVEHIAIAYNVF